MENCEKMKKRIKLIRVSGTFTIAFSLKDDFSNEICIRDHFVK